MDTNAYITFLLVGVLLVAIDGQIIYRSGRRYLENSSGDTAAGASMIRLITVLFHLVVLGLIALLSMIDFGGDSAVAAIVGRLGIVLLLLAIAHAVTMGVLARLREDQVGEDLADRRAARDSVVAPVPGQQGRDPSVSPSLDRAAPYTTGPDR